VVAGSLALLLGASSVQPTVAAAAPAPTSVSDERVVVRFAPAVEPERRGDVAAQAGYELVEELVGSDFALAVAVRPDAGPDGVAVVDVSPLQPVEVAGLTGDPLARYQWHLPAIRAPQAWEVGDGTGAVVAVIDTGVADPDATGQSRAPDLAGTAFVPGWDFVEDDPIPQDENGHGTHVTSTIAATTGNGIGVAGVAPGATIMPLRVLDATGRGDDFNVARALRWATDHGANVANLSIGSTSASRVLLEQIAYARSKGVTVVAATGNDGRATVSWPAAEPSVVAVGATRLDSTRPAYSNHGPTLDIVAPGGDLSVDQDGDGKRDGILQESLDPDNRSEYCWCYLAGTSMAAPQVSAVAAMLVGLGVTAPAEVERILMASAWDLGPVGRDDQYGHGMLDAHAAVLHAIGQPPTPAGTVRGIGTACPPGQVPPAGFGDVGDTLHAQAIDCVAWWGLASGATATSFDPRGTVTRAQMASFLARLVDASEVRLQEAPPDAFTDDDGSIHEHRIDQLAAAGIIRGRTPGIYAPGAPVTRAEMATFLARTHDLIATERLRVSADRFSDDQGSVHEPSIDSVSAVGVAAGTTTTTFQPGVPVRREQMATFLARLLDLLVDGGEIAAR
jgi:subtilisin family serine protease